MRRFQPNGFAVTGLIAVLLLLMPMVLSRAGMVLATEFCVVLSIAMMWNLLAGFTGIIFIGVPLFIGIGGYTLYLLALNLGMAPYPFVLAGGIVSALAAIGLAPLLFRLSGAQLAIGSWVMAEIARLAVLLTPELGGGGGMTLSVMRAVPRAWRMILNYYAGAAVLLIAILATVTLMRSKYGLALRGMSDSSVAAEAMGVNVANLRRLTLAIAAFITGAAGAAYYISALQISPASAFSMNWTAMVIFAVIIGGIGSVEGPIIGAAVYFILRESLSDLGSGYFILSGLIAIGVTVFMPSGLWGALRKYLPFDLLPIRHAPYRLTESPKEETSKASSPVTPVPAKGRPTDGSKTPWSVPSNIEAKKESPTMKAIKAAAVQAAPVYMKLDASISKAEKIVAEAAANGAKLVAFPETWLPGYPWFIWLGAPAEGIAFIPQYHANSMELHSPEMKRLQKLAAKHEITLVMGYSEREGGSRYMSQVIIGEEGEILLNRRKLKPTHVERTIFGEGDGSDLQVVDAVFGRLGALNCWEHMQPLAKMAMFAQHEEVHVAGWPSFCVYREMAYALGPEVNLGASRQYAVEGSSYVLAACAIVSQEMFDMLADAPQKAALLNPQTSQPGGGFAMIYGPDGRALCEPIPEDQEGILYADLDPAMIAIAKSAADPAGHYSRADSVKLVINREKRQVMEDRNLTEASGFEAIPLDPEEV